MDTHKIIMLSLLFILSCATAGQKYVQIDYSGTPENTASGNIAISPIIDNRTPSVKGQIGYRILLDNSQETYLVQGLDLGKALTDAAEQYLGQSGYQVNRVKDWELSPDNISDMEPPFSRLVAGQVNQFECRAKKKGGHTTMVLDIDMTIYIGNPKAGTLKTTPVAFSLEKTVFTFSTQKLETFINESLVEIFEKSLML